MSNFTSLDWLIVVVYVVGSGAAGLMCRKYVSNSRYVVAPFLWT